MPATISGILKITNHTVQHGSNKIGYEMYVDCMIIIGYGTSLYKRKLHKHLLALLQLWFLCVLKVKEVVKENINVVVAREKRPTWHANFENGA